MQDHTSKGVDRVREKFLIVWGKNQVCGLQCAFGPATTFRLAGPILHLGPRGREAARYRDGAWINRKTGGRFPFLWTETPSVVRLEDPLTGTHLVLGTFYMLGVVGNTIYAERENSRAVATLDEQSGCWRTSLDDREWRDLVLQPALTLPNAPLDSLLPSG